MKRAISVRFLLEIIILACPAILLPIAVGAIEYPLPADQVDQAFSLGRATDHNEFAGFLSAYQHDFQSPPDQPRAYVKSIELETPYEQVVLKSMHVPEYDRSRAEEDYQENGGKIIVRAVVTLTLGYGIGIPTDDDDFAFTVSQGSRIEPQETNMTVLCNPLNPFAIYPVEPCVVYLREYLLRFNEGQFGRGKVTVKLKMPGGKSVETKFDLDKLK